MSVSSSFITVSDDTPDEVTHKIAVHDHSSGGATALAFSNMSTVATGGADGYLKVWDIN
jgi:WD40 repeat protein